MGFLRPSMVRDMLPQFTSGNYWAALEKSTGQFVGWIALQPKGRGDPSDVELGYRLHKAAWGKRYATEGSRYLIRKGITDLGVRRAWAHTMAVNIRSGWVMEKAGLNYVRTFHEAFDDPLPGTEYGEVEYALTKPEWERQHTEELATDHVAVRSGDCGAVSEDVK